VKRDKHNCFCAQRTAVVKIHCRASRVVKDYGIRSGNAELILNTCIAEGEIIAVFEETATIWSQDDVREFERVAVKQIETESDVQKFEFYVNGSNPENQCHLHILIEYLVKTQSLPCLWKSPHPSDIRCKVDPNGKEIIIDLPIGFPINNIISLGKVWGNLRITHAASDTKTSSYSSSWWK